MGAGQSKANKFLSIQKMSTKDSPGKLNSLPTSLATEWENHGWTPGILTPHPIMLLLVDDTAICMTL